jgi:hypothetical protein
MNSATTTIATVAALLMSPAGCVTVSNLAVSAACPFPTPRPKLEAIVSYLERAAPDPGLDTLAVEFERLNDGAIICNS